MPPSPLDKPGWVLTFHDEFEGPALDTAKWLAANHMGSYSEKAGVYSLLNGVIGRLHRRRIPADPIVPNAGASRPS
jgi:hypothetical protein